MTGAATGQLWPDCNDAAPDARMHGAYLIEPARRALPGQGGQAIEIERVFGPSLDGQFARRHQAGHAEGDRRALDRGAVRADPRRPSPEIADQAAAPAQIRGGAEAPSGLDAGAQRHLRAVVDEIVGRAEFLTSVWGSPQSDHGRNQAWFEYASQLGELLEMDVVQLPVYSWGCAA